MKPIRIVLVGGGSGGHVYPLVAITKSIRTLALKRAAVIELIYMGPRDPYGEELKTHDIRTIFILTGKLRRYFSLLTLIDIPKIFLGTLQAFWRMFWIMPEVVFSKGGTGSFPIVFVAWVYRIPIVIHESDARPGLTNVCGAMLASRIAVSFREVADNFPPQKVFVSGNPIREEFFEPQPNQGDAKKLFGFRTDSPLTLFLGGSQGAMRINEFVLLHLRELNEITQILHATGRAHYAATKKIAEDIVETSSGASNAYAYHTTPFLERQEIPAALVAADLVVSRAGSNAIFEIAAMGKPAILIPITESANDHQRENAYTFANKGGGIVIEEKNLLPAIFLGTMRSLLTDSVRRGAMAAASKAFFIPGANDAIAQEIFSFLPLPR